MPEPNTIGELSLVLSLAVFLLTVTYQCGRLAERIAHLEKWRDESARTFDALHAAIRRLELHLTEQPHP